MLFRSAATASTEREALEGLVRSYVPVMRESADLLLVGGEIRALTDAERAELRRSQREYVSEWVRLLMAVRGELTAPEARVVVHMALTIANDLVRTGAVRRRPDLDAELPKLMLAALGIS